MLAQLGINSGLLPLWDAKRKNGSRNQRGYSLLCKGIALSGLVLLGLAITHYRTSTGEEYIYGQMDRRLEESKIICREKTEEERNDSCAQAPPAWFIAPYFLGTMYMFWAIAIICDDFFVPSLEVIGERLNIGDDIAGATLMAAGGSAPELATSLIGTFTGSDVGFGTIVGSAVFNVLFVIACCVAFTPEKFAPLELTWWPLARDCTYYIISLIILSIFFGVISPNKIELWEALILFMMYLGYCTIMYFNEYLQEKFSTARINPDGTNTTADNGVEMAPSPSVNSVVPASEVSVKKADGTSPLGSARKDDSITPRDPSKNFVRRNSLYKASKFRVGFLKLATNNASVLDHASLSIVYKLKGTVKELFEQLDVDKSGELERNEIETMLNFLFSGTSTTVTTAHVDEIMKELDLNNNGAITLPDFTEWYLKSGEEIRE